MPSSVNEISVNSAAMGRGDLTGYYVMSRDILECKYVAVHRNTASNRVREKTSTDRKDIESLEMINLFQAVCRTHVNV